MEPYLLECPHCLHEWDIDPNDDLCHADDKVDGILTTCDECGEKFELTTTTEVFFHAVKPTEKTEMPDDNDRNDPKWTIIKDDRIRGVICNLMSEMLDNPNKHGIYPTGRFMSKMEQFILDERSESADGDSS